MLIRLSGYELYKWDTEVWVSWILNTAHGHGRVVKTLDMTQVEVETQVRISVASDRIINLESAEFY